MSFLKIGDRAAGAIKSGGTTRRAAKMVCLDLDHPDVEDVRQLESPRRAEGRRDGRGDQAPRPRSSRRLAKKLGLKLDYDFNGEAYYTVSGQNSNNSVRIPNALLQGRRRRRRLDTSPAAPTARSPRRSRPATCGTRSPTPPGAAPTPACSTTTRSTSGTPARKSGRINASNPCVTGDTRVLTPGGIWRRIDQMIHLPSRVVTNLDGQEIHVTDGAFPTGTKDVYELRTAGGYSVKLTADHKVWTRAPRLGRGART